MMTHRRLNLLLTGLLFLALAVLILMPYCAHADDWDWHVGGYLTASVAGSMGYDDPGIGTQIEASARWKFLELYGMGRLAYQHKKEASSGYTWGWNLQGRGYIWENLYLLAEYKRAGYRSEFESGTVWKKMGYQYGGGLGLNLGYLDAWLTIYNKEHMSPNQVWTSSLNIRAQIWEWLWALGTVNYSTWDQAYGADIRRLSGVTGTIGIGLRW